MFALTSKTTTIWIILVYQNFYVAQNVGSIDKMLKPDGKLYSNNWNLTMIIILKKEAENTIDKKRYQH